MAEGEDDEVLDSVDYLVDETLDSDGDAEVLKDIQEASNKATSLEDLAGSLRGVRHQRGSAKETTTSHSPCPVGRARRV